MDEGDTGLTAWERKFGGKRGDKKRAEMKGKKYKKEQKEDKRS